MLTLLKNRFPAIPRYTRATPLGAPFPDVSSALTLTAWVRDPELRLIVARPNVTFEATGPTVSAGGAHRLADRAAAADAAGTAVPTCASATIGVAIDSVQPSAHVAASTGRGNLMVRPSQIAILSRRD